METPDFFKNLPDTTPSSNPIAFAILKFLNSYDGNAPYWQIYNEALGKKGHDDPHVWRRYEYRIALALTALTSQQLVACDLDVSAYHLTRYRVSLIGQQVTEGVEGKALDKVMQELDAARGYTAQTTFLNGLEVIAATTPGLPYAQATTGASVAASSKPRSPGQHSEIAGQPAQPALPKLVELLGEPFDPASISDERALALREVVQRRGQDTFRALLLEVFNRRCAITGCDAEDVLEAAHIISYKGEKTNHPANGLLLRADLHQLFDRGLLAIDTRSMTVLIAPRLMTTCYQDLAGTSLKLPGGAYQISPEALDIHRAWAEQTWRNEKRGTP